MSIYLPLHDCLAKILKIAIQYEQKSVSFSLGILPEDTKRMALRLVAHPMRIMALTSQVKAQMWVRNGNSLHGQVYAYHNNLRGLSL